MQSNLPPVIINQSHAQSLVTRQLRNAFRQRISPNCDADFIFPTLRVSYIVYGLNELTDKDKILDAITRMQKVANMFQKCYALIIFSSDKQHSIKTYQQIQMSITSNKPVLVPFNTAAEAAAFMTETSKAHSKENELFQSQLCEELLAQVSSELTACKLLTTIPGLNEKDCELLWHGLGTLANISQASVQDILERTPLKRTKALAVVEFFSRDTDALD